MSAVRRSQTAAPIIRPRAVLVACRQDVYSPRMDSPDWSSLSDDELLERKISRLGLKLDGTPLQPLIQQLYDELSQKGLTFHPPTSATNGSCR